MKNIKTYYTIADLKKVTNISVPTLLFWIKKEKMPAAIAQTAGGRLLWDERAIQKITKLYKTRNPVGRKTNKEKEIAKETANENINEKTE